MERYFSIQRVLWSSFSSSIFFRTFAFISILDTTPWTTFRSFLSFLNLETANYRHFPFVLQNITKRKAKKSKKRLKRKKSERRKKIVGYCCRPRWKYNNVRWPFFCKFDNNLCYTGYVYLIQRRKAILIVSYSNFTCCTSLYVNVEDLHFGRPQTQKDKCEKNYQRHGNFNNMKGIGQLIFK